MRARNITATAVSTLAAAAGMAPIAAHAADPVTLVVSTPDRGCSDTEPTTAYCTVNAALASPSLVPGSGIVINGDHPENVTITKSGISIGVGPWGGGTLTSVTVSGAQNVELSRLWSTFTVSDSYNVKLHQVNSTALNVSDTQYLAVDDRSQLMGPGTVATIQNSPYTSISNSQIHADTTGGSAPAITVTGSSSGSVGFLDDQFRGGGSAIALTGGAHDTTIANDDVESYAGSPAFAVTGAPMTEIVGNTVRGTGQGIVATGGSTGLTIADNILFAEIDFPGQPLPGPMVVVDGTSTGAGTLHHNIVDEVRTDGDAALLAQPSATSQVLGQTDLFGLPSAPGPAYSWGGAVYQNAADLQSHTGQGVADINADPQFTSPWADTLRATSPAVDSADSSVQGWQNLDAVGASRFKDPYSTATTGTGAIPYADRGAVEFQGGPTIVAAVTPVTRPSTTVAGQTDYGFQIDLSGSQSPFAAVKSYGMSDYGNSCQGGTGMSSTSPTGTVWCPPGSTGTHLLMLTVTDASGHTDQIFAEVYAGPRSGSVPVVPPPVVPPNVPPPSGSAGQATVRRIGGTDRYQTSRMVSQAQWGDGQAAAVVLARGDAAPDALTGVPLAARMHGPLLLTDPAALGGADRAELDRVLGGPATHKTVYILGGTSAVSPAIETELQRAGYTVHRLFGTDRYGTALAVAHQFGATSHVIVATGANFPDALAAGPLGAVEGAPIVLSHDAVLDPQTAAFISSHADVDAVGYQAWSATKGLAGSGHAVSPMYGGTRYQTAAAVAGQVGRMSGRPEPVGAGVSSGVTFPDALTGGAFAANAGLPLLLTPPNALAPDTAMVLQGWARSLTSVTIFGGPNAVTRPVADAITRVVGGRAAY